MFTRTHVRKFTYHTPFMFLLFTVLLIFTTVSYADPECGGNGEDINNCNCYKITLKNNTSGDLSLGGFTGTKGGTFFGATSQSLGPNETMDIYVGTTDSGQESWTATSAVTVNVGGTETTLTMGFNGIVKEKLECMATFSLMPNKTYGQIGSCGINENRPCDFCAEAGVAVPSEKPGGTKSAPGDAVISSAVCSLK